MKPKTSIFILLLLASLIVFISAGRPLLSDDAPPGLQRYLYVAVPGIRDYLGYGGHGILVFDINRNHQFVKRIHTNGLHPDKTPSNVKGLAVSLPLNSIYVSTVE